jgi:hypothetical protein
MKRDQLILDSLARKRQVINLCAAVAVLFVTLLIVVL